MSKHKKKKHTIIQSIKNEVRGVYQQARIQAHEAQRANSPTPLWQSFIDTIKQAVRDYKKGKVKKSK